MCRSRASGFGAGLKASIFCLVLLACGSGARPRLDQDARQYVRLAVALGERDPDSLDYYAGPSEAVADLRRNPPPLAVIKRDAEELSGRISAYRSGDPAANARAARLVRDLAAIAARVDLLTGARPRFDQESMAFFGMAAPPLDERSLGVIRSRLAELIGGQGRLVVRYAAFAAKFIIPAERLQPVLAAALDACRQATLARVALPAGEQATLELVRDKPWSAFSRYLGGGRSVIQVNRDFGFTIDQALAIACHEGYPGHHTRNTLRTAATGGAFGAQAERAVQLMFSPESLTSEASAMLAAEVAFSPDERLRLERDRLFPLAKVPPTDAASHIEVERLVGELQLVQADVALRYLDGQLEYARAVAELEERALVPHAEAQLKYINQFRSYLTTYIAGPAVFAARLRACAGAAPPDTAVRWRCFVQESSRP